MKKGTLLSLALFALCAGVGLIGTNAFALVDEQAQEHLLFGPLGIMGHRGFGIAGTVTAISGAELTVESRMPGSDTTQTSFLVDASSAAITKDGAQATVSDISVGDIVAIRGTVDGTAVVATAVNDGSAWGRPANAKPPVPPSFQGDGQPVIGGTVTATSGATLTVSTANNLVYTVDIANATIFKKGIASASPLDVAVGDHVIVQGGITGTAVVASSVIDTGTKASKNTHNSDTDKDNADNDKDSDKGASANAHANASLHAQAGLHGGFFGRFFGGLGGLLRHLFGFF